VFDISMKEQALKSRPMREFTDKTSWVDARGPWSTSVVHT